MTEPLEARVVAALARIRNERLENDVLSAGMVRNLVVGDDGTVTFTFLLANEDKGTLVRQVRRAVEMVDGVTDVRIQVTNPAPARASHGPPGTEPAVPAPTRREELGTVIAISSGKGGVGKSTVAANLAVALAQAGYRVGVMDADIYGPNMPRMFGLHEKPMVNPDTRKIIPLEAHGVKLMSLGLLVERDAPAIWRGPIIMKVIQQFLQDVAWGELDYFIVDLPPGTGDAQLSLVQATQVSGAVIVTTPQEMAVGDALRGAKMFERVGVPVLGVVENMSAFTDPETGRTWALFSSGGGARLAEEVGVPLLGSIPLQPGLADEADHGKPVLVVAADSPAATALASVAGAIVQAAQAAATPLPVING
jgi:ATP-binding protein involved in chromosome partitioning